MLGLPLHSSVLRKLHELHPNLFFHSITEFDNRPTSILASPRATFYRYLTWKGKRFVASNSAGSRKRSLACVFQPQSEHVDAPLVPRVLEILDIIQIHQTLSQQREVLHTWLHVRWLLPLTELHEAPGIPAGWKEM